MSDNIIEDEEELTPYQLAGGITYVPEDTTEWRAQFSIMLAAEYWGGHGIDQTIAAATKIEKFLRAPRSEEEPEAVIHQLSVYENEESADE